MLGSTKNKYGKTINKYRNINFCYMQKMGCCKYASERNFILPYHSALLKAWWQQMHVCNTIKNIFYFFWSWIILHFKNQIMSTKDIKIPYKNNIFFFFSSFCTLKVQNFHKSTTSPRTLSRTSQFFICRAEF